MAVAGAETTLNIDTFEFILYVFTKMFVCSQQIKLSNKESLWHQF